MLSKALTGAAPAVTGQGAGQAAEPAGTGMSEPAGTTLHSPGHEAAGDVVDVAELAAAEYAQVRQALEHAVGAAVSPPAPVSSMQRRQLRGGPKPMADVDFPSYRRRYSLLQQKMESTITPLRGRLRSLLAAQSPEMARLVAVDAAMEQALGEQELRLLAGIPGLLEGRFEHLLREHQAALPTGAENPSKQSAPADPLKQLGAANEPGPWLDTFRADMRSVLLAELDLRLQPIEGLLSALRAA